jgi:hypothetical protein
MHDSCVMRVKTTCVLPEEVRAGTSIYLSGFRDGMDALADETGRRRSKGWDVGEASVRRSSLNGQEEEDEEEETLRGFYLVMSDDRDADHDPTSFLICVSSDRLGDHELTATELDSLSWTPVTTGSWIPSISESLGVVNMPISKPTPLPLERGGTYVLRPSVRGPLQCQRPSLQLPTSAPDFLSFRAMCSR